MKCSPTANAMSLLFFSEKINNIRKEIGTSSSYAEVSQIRPQCQKEVTMSVFEANDSNILEEIVQHLKSSTCYLDIFFQKCFNCLEANILEVVNTSHLKKSNLDNTILSNYRPIPYLPIIGKNLKGCF